MSSEKSALLLQAYALLNKAKEVPREELIALAQQLAKIVLEIGQKQATFKERFISRMMAAMMDDPIGKYFTTTLMDRFFRSHRFSTQWQQFSEMKERIGIPTFLPSIFQVAIESLQTVAHYVPALSTKLLQSAIRWQTQEVIVDAKTSCLKAHLKERKKQNIRINLNHLGEAILGEEEAAKRLNIYLKDLKNPLIEYISVKISTLYSQINPLAKDQTLSILQKRLSLLYEAALENTYTGPGGKKSSKFVNLDMEEYGDLDLTIELFKQTLDQPAFSKSRAGIVLQSYIPNSWPKLLELIEFSKKRVQRGAEPIKIRLVKGANLAMEQWQARVKGWSQAPYSEKSLVDANFKRLLQKAMEACAQNELILGVGSHNLFDICYALLLRQQLGTGPRVELEMLEGMAPQIRRAIQLISSDMLLYCPVANQEEFSSAIAYLVRRLDENTGTDNFLRHFFHLDQKPEIFESEAKRFEKSFSLIDSLLVDSFRSPRILQEEFLASSSLKKVDEALSLPFKNEPDTDWSCPSTSLFMRQFLEKQALNDPVTLPCVISGQTYLCTQDPSLKIDTAYDLSRPGVKVFDMTLASWDMVDRALNTAKASHL